ncbi:MAG: hypothetical protein V1494_05875 [Candidatus Diapherotrites archaeon]
MSVLNLLVSMGEYGFSPVVQLFAEQPFWVFAFAVTAYFLYNKKILVGFPVVVIFVWLQVDWSNVTGLAFGSLPVVWLMAHIAVSAFTSDYKFMGKHAPYGALVLFVALLLVKVNFGGF